MNCERPPSEGAASGGSLRDDIALLEILDFCRVFKQKLLLPKLNPVTLEAAVRLPNPGSAAHSTLTSIPQVYSAPLTTERDLLVDVLCRLLTTDSEAPVMEEDWQETLDSAIASMLSLGEWRGVNPLEEELD